MKVKRTKVTVLKTRGTNPARRICPYNCIGKCCIFTWENRINEEDNLFCDNDITADGTAYTGICHQFPV